MNGCVVNRRQARTRAMLINLFEIPSMDRSVYYLGQIFGYVGSVLPAKNPSLLVGMMFKTLNTVALTIGAFMVVYVTVVGLLKTAQEGEFLGKQWNSLWVPLRTVLGITALFPTATGYSAIQVVIMWIILQGVGAADTLWTQVIKYVNLMGSPYGGVSTDNLNPIQIQGNMKSLFQSLSCQASAKLSNNDIVSTIPGKASIKYFCGQKGNTDLFCKRTDSEMLNPIDGPQVTHNMEPVRGPDNKPITNPDGTTQMIEGSLTYSMGPTLGKCGSIKFCSVIKECKKTDPTKPDSARCLACKAQQSALQTIVPTLGAVASQFATIDNLYATFYELPVTPQSTPDWMKDYCSTMGVSPAQCCVTSLPTLKVANINVNTGPVCSYKNFPNDRAQNDATNTSSSKSAPINASNSATDLYLKYPLGVYLNGSDFINAVVGEYMAAIVGAVSTAVQNQMNEAPLQQDWYQLAISYGWITAGAFYYDLAGQNQVNQDAINLPLTYAPPEASDAFLKTYRNNYNAVGDLISAMIGANSGNSGFVQTPGMTGDISNALGTSAASLMTNWKNSLTSNSCAGARCDYAGGARSTNPLISIATFGYQMMITAQLLFAVITVAAAAFAAVSSINPIFWGIGLTESPFYAAFKVLVSLVGPFFVILIASLFSIGAMLGIYVPLIPYMIFTLGAIGWLIATVEAMVAGPIIALGILSPGGQHDILGRAEPALMQLLNLFLRPVLMIFGLILSMFFVIVVVNLVNTGFLYAATQIIRSPGLFEQILFIAAYTTFIITVVNKAFSLIYVVPERVTTWIGGHAVSYGEEQAMGETKQSVQGAAAKSAKGMKHTAEGAGEMGKAVADAKQASDKRKEAQAPAVEAKKNDQGS